MIEYQESFYVTGTGRIVDITSDYKWRAELYGYAFQDKPMVELHRDGERQTYFRLEPGDGKKIKELLNGEGTPAGALLTDISQKIVLKEV